MRYGEVEPEDCPDAWHTEDHHFIPTRPTCNDAEVIMEQTPESMRKSLVDRLRGKYTVPIADGAGPLNGSDTFTQNYETTPICLEAADEIERLRRSATTLIGWWRAASNVMSEAEGDGPVRSSLRRCAKDLEEALSGVGGHIRTIP